MRTRYHHTLTAVKRDDETLDAVALRLVADSAALANVRREVEAAADHAQKTLAGMEKERNAAIEEANLLRTERTRALAELATVAKDRENYRQWWQAAQQGVASSVDTIAELRAVSIAAEDARRTAETAGQTLALKLRDASAEVADLREAAKRQRMATDAAVDDAATHGRMVGGLVGLVVGVVVTGLLVAAL